MARNAKRHGRHAGKFLIMIWKRGEHCSLTAITV